MKKIVATDLDGTLLNNKSEISKENFLAIERLAKRGVEVVPASGRTLSEIPKEIRTNKNIRYIIYSNGAAVKDMHTGEDILMCIPKSVAKKTFDIINSFDTHITVRYGGQCFIDAKFQTEKDYEYYNVWKLHKEVINEYAVFSNDFKNLCYAADNIEVMSVFFHNDTEKEECKKLLLQTGKLCVVEGWAYNLEICSIEAGKGEALHRLADKLGIDYNDTIAVGDSDNDTSMIKAAGLGLAMGNAIDKLKEAADEVICTNEEHAIDYILSHYYE